MRARFFGLLGICKTKRNWRSDHVAFTWRTMFWYISLFQALRDSVVPAHIDCLTVLLPTCCTRFWGLIRPCARSYSRIFLGLCASQLVTMLPFQLYVILLSCKEIHMCLKSEILICSVGSSTQLHTTKFHNFTVLAHPQKIEPALQSLLGESGGFCCSNYHYLFSHAATK